MRILFLSHYFPPEVNAPATRTYEHCKQWAAMGHDVTVVSCVPHHPMGKVYPGYRNRFYTVEHKDGIKAIKIWTYITANEGFVKRTLNYILYMLMAILISPFLKKADVVISTSPQFFNGFAGYFVSRIKRCPWLLEIRDLWPESIVAVGAIKNVRMIRLLESIERFAYRKADHLVPVTNAFCTHILAHGARPEQLTMIRNGVNLELFKPTPYDTSLADQLGVRDKFVLSYVGTHGMAHGLDVMLEAAEQLQDDDRIRFLLVGDGSERVRLEEEVARRGLGNVVMLGQQPKHRMPAIWSISNVSLVVLRRLELFKTVIPSKIFESMAMKKPIILGVEGESRALIEEANAGICIQPENSEQLAKAARLLVDDKRRYQQFSQDGFHYARQHCDRASLARLYEGVLCQLSSNTSQLATTDKGTTDNI